MPVDSLTQRADQYRQYAKHAEWLAEQTHDVEAKRLFKETARYWRLRAELERPL
jgi:hypothetical protein